MITIKIDKKVLFKGEAGEWIQKTPSAFKDAIKPGARPAPWMKAIAITLADALMSNNSIKISVTTGPGKWTMAVEQ